jgi:hypothetical protein
VDIGNVLSEAVDLYKRFWQHLIGLALVFYVVASAVTLGLTIAFGRWGAAVGALILLVGIFWLTGALVEAIADVRDGRADLTFSETFSRVWPQLVPLMGASILAGLGIAAGLILLIVPGLILLTWWCLIPAAIVLEKRGVMESFGRSRDLVRGHGWSVFGVLFITYALTSIVSGIIRAVFGAIPTYAGEYAANVIAGALIAPFSALAVTVMYFTLTKDAAPAGDSGVPASLES